MQLFNLVIDADRRSVLYIESMVLDEVMKGDELDPRFNGNTGQCMGKELLCTFPIVERHSTKRLTSRFTHEHILVSSHFCAESRHADNASANWVI